MQTILGSNGVISTNLAKALTKYTSDIRLVSRNPKKVNVSDTIQAADLLDAAQTLRAVTGSSVVYLTAGLQYEAKIWQVSWPKLMHNVIDACKKENAKLVFFDNVYALGKVSGHMTEETPMNPCSKKGEVRAVIENMILDEVKAGNLNAILARAADFYGPATAASFVTMLVFDRLKKGKKAQWLVDAKVKHSLTWTPDAGKATAILGNTESAYNQIWNIPTHKDPLTGEQFIALAAKEFGASAKYMTFPKIMMQLGGLFDKLIKELIEMLYQYDSDYIFDSTKFEKAFNFGPISYEEGIKTIAAEMK